MLQTDMTLLIRGDALGDTCYFSKAIKKMHES